MRKQFGDRDLFGGPLLRTLWGSRNPSALLALLRCGRASDSYPYIHRRQYNRVCPRVHPRTGLGVNECDGCSSR